jgi:hypothetical protein
MIQSQKAIPEPLPSHLPATPSCSNLFQPSTQGWVRSTEIEIPTLEIVPPIRRERHRFPARTLHCKRGNENQKFSTSTNRRSEDVIILQEPFRIPLTDPELYEESDNKIHHHGRVDTHREVAQVVTNDWCNEVVKTGCREIPVEEVGWKGYSESGG